VHPPGTYTVTITGTATESSETQTATFSFTIDDVCNPPTSLTAPSYTNQNYVLAQTSQSYTPADFTIVPAHCSFDAVATPSALAPPSITSPVTVTSHTDFSIFYDTDLQPAGQTQTVTVTATSKTLKTTFNSQTTPETDSGSFDVTYTNPCLDPTYTTVSTTTQSGTTTITDNYSGTTNTFQYTPYTVTPSVCSLEVVCSTITGASSALTCGSYPMSANTVTVTLGETEYKAAAITPGTYTFTYKVKPVGSSNVALEKDLVYTLTLNDPCDDPQVSVATSPTFSTQTVTIADS